MKFVIAHYYTLYYIITLIIIRFYNVLSFYIIFTSLHIITLPLIMYLTFNLQIHYYLLLHKLLHHYYIIITSLLHRYNIHYYNAITTLLIPFAIISMYF